MLRQLRALLLGLTFSACSASLSTASPQNKGTAKRFALIRAVLSSDALNHTGVLSPDLDLSKLPGATLLHALRPAGEGQIALIAVLAQPDPALTDAFVLSELHRSLGLASTQPLSADFNLPLQTALAKFVSDYANDSELSSWTGASDLSEADLIAFLGFAASAAATLTLRTENASLEAQHRIWRSLVTSAQYTRKTACDTITGQQEIPYAQLSTRWAATLRQVLDEILQNDKWQTSQASPAIRRWQLRYGRREELDFIDVERAIYEDEQLSFTRADHFDLSDTELYTGLQLANQARRFALCHAMSGETPGRVRLSVTHQLGPVETQVLMPVRAESPETPAKPTLSAFALRTAGKPIRVQLSVPLVDAQVVPHYWGKHVAPGASLILPGSENDEFMEVVAQVFPSDSAQAPHTN